MTTLSRREFLQTGAAAAGAAFALAGSPSTLAWPLDGVMGLQSAMFEDASWKEAVSIARELGLKEMVCAGGAPGGRGSTTPATVDSWKAYADLLNKAGAKTKPEGLQLGWHNHGEFRPIDGGGGLNPFDVLLQNTDPAVVK